MTGWVYRMYDNTGALLYIGQTTKPWKRLLAYRHAALREGASAAYSRPWFYNVHRISWTQYDSAKALARAERDAIAEENPRYNVRFRKRVAI